MIFRRTILAALFAGLLAGLALSIVQVFAINPIIFEAETFEIGSHDHGSHDHSAHNNGGEAPGDAWAPEDGNERAGYTVLSNIFAGIGFAAILLSLMSQCHLQGFTQISNLKGVLWGVAGFAVFFVAPGLGLPPEIPGIEAAPVEHRQIWWVLTVIAVGVGLAVLFFAPLAYKLFGLILAAMPYLVYVPHHTGPAFAHPDPQAVETLTGLHERFIIMSGVGSFVFWLVLGVLCAWLLTTRILHDSSHADSSRGDHDNSHSETDSLNV